MKEKSKSLLKKIALILGSIMIGIIFLGAVALWFVFSQYQSLFSNSSQFIFQNQSNKTQTLLIQIHQSSTEVIEKTLTPQTQQILELQGDGSMTIEIKDTDITNHIGYFTNTDQWQIVIPSDQSSLHITTF